jgi:DNA polymerase (family 10)
VFRVRDSDGEAAEDRIGGAHEKDIFDAVGMAWVAPELREDRGEIPAALDHALPALVTIGDIRGDLHMHSTWSDGRDTIEAMARGCIDRGYHYMAICDHSATLSIARGLDAARLERQWEEIDRIREMLPGIAILRGMEVDILEDGTLDLPDSHLGRLDIVVASVHSLMRMSGIRMTDRVIRAMQHPRVRILGHPTGRLIGERPPFDIDVDAVLRAAAELAVAVEVNALPYRLDLNDVHLRRAKELDVRIVIDTDAHSVAGLARMAGGVDQARRGWIEPSDVVNTMSLADLRSWLERRPA